MGTFHDALYKVILFLLRSVGTGLGLEIRIDFQPFHYN